MYEFGDEVIISSYRIPWLIWIQLLAMLLLLLLYSFTDDFSLNFTATDSPPSATANTHRNSKVEELVSRKTIGDIAHSYPRNVDRTQVRENEIKETGTSTSEVVQRAKKPGGRPRTESSTANESSGVRFEHSHHPCHFFGVA